MPKQTKLTFTFDNPNSSDGFRKGLAQIVVDRLLSQYNNLNNQPISKNEGDGSHPPDSKRNEPIEPAVQ